MALPDVVHQRVGPRPLDGGPGSLRAVLGLPFRRQRAKRGWKGVAQSADDHAWRRPAPILAQACGATSSRDDQLCAKARLADDRIHPPDAESRTMGLATREWPAGLCSGRSQCHASDRERSHREPADAWKRVSWAQPGTALLVANLATQCVVCGRTSRPIRPEPWFPATAGRMRLFPGLPTSERRRRRHRTVGASPGFRHRRVSRHRQRADRHDGRAEAPAFAPRRVRATARANADSQPRFDSPRGVSAEILSSLVLASCASIASPGSLPRNQKTAGFSRLPSFAGQAGVVEPGLHLRRSARTSDVCRAVLAGLELTQVRRVAPVGPARSARRARRSLGSGRLLVCRSRATQPRFGLADRRSSRAGHERRHASSTAATCEATSARACPRSTPDISSVS